MSHVLIQPLEARMLRAAVTATLAGGKLTVTGTDAADTLYFYGGEDAKGNETLDLYLKPRTEGVKPNFSFVQSAIKSLLVDAKGGNDIVSFDQFDLYSHGNFSLATPQTILGGEGNDSISAYGADTLMGQGGNDFLYGTGTLDGGTGNDVLTAADSDESGELYTVTMLGGDGNDALQDFGDGSVVDAGAGDDTVFAQRPATVHLGSGNDKYDLELFHTDEVFIPNVVYGDDGNDYIFYRGSDDAPSPLKNFFTAYGGNGNDTLIGGSGNELLKGEAGNDQLHGGAGNDTLDGGIGNDLIYGDAGNDQLFGSDGNDTLYGGSGNNKLYGQGGKNTIHSVNGSVDTIFGSGAADVLDRDKFDVLSA